MNLRIAVALGASVCVAVLLAACGGSSPQPPTGPAPPSGPPANAKPSIGSMTAQGRRANQPARFADVGETIDVAATVTDAETPLDELAYQWSATSGTFTGTGRSVTWTAPASATTPTTVTLTLKVVENYGHPGQAKIYSQDVSSTVTVSLHDSAKEVGGMAERFLTEFSKPQTNRDWRDVMRDFDLNGGTCADSGEIENERRDVERHYNNFYMNSFDVGTARVTVAFKQSCVVPDRNPKAGDACASVAVRWDSTNTTSGVRGVSVGTDYLAAAYSASADRWWLCSSDFVPSGTVAHSFYAGR